MSGLQYDGGDAGTVPGAPGDVAAVLVLALVQQLREQLEEPSRRGRRDVEVLRAVLGGQFNRITKSPKTGPKYCPRVKLKRITVYRVTRHLDSYILL